MALIDPFNTDSSNLVDPFAPAAPERGLIGETVTAVKRGGVRTLEMVGQAAKAVDPAGGVDIVRGAGEGITKYAQERVKKADIAESTYAETHPILGNIPQGAEMLVSSVGVPLAAAGGIAAAGVSAPVAIAAGGLTAGALFGLSQFTDTKERALAAGLSEEEANKAATKAALIEGGGEALSNVIPIGNMLKLGKPAAGNVIKSLFGAATTKDVAKNLANNTLQIMGGEVTTEMAQAYGQAKVEKDAGVRPDADPWAEAKDVVGPTIALSIMTGGIVGGANKLSRVATQRALQNEKVGADARTSAAMGVYESLVNAEKAGTAPAGSAENFRAHSAAAIKNKAPLVLSDDLLKPLVAAPKTSNESMKEALTEALALAADPSNDMGITDAIKATNERKVSERLAANATENLDKIDQQIIDLTEEVVEPAPVVQPAPPYTDTQAAIMRESIKRGKVTVPKAGPMPWQIAWADENGLEITKVGSTPSASGSSVTRDWRIIPKEVQDATQEGVGREGVRTELGGVEEVSQTEGTRGVVPEAVQETGAEAGLGNSVLPAEEVRPSEAQAGVTAEEVRPSEAQAGVTAQVEEIAPVAEPAAPKVVRRRKAAAQAAPEVAPEPVAEAEAVEPAAERPTPGGPPVFVTGADGREEAVQVDRDGERVVWAWRGGRKNEWFADVKADLLADGETVDLNTVDVPIEFRKDAARAFQAAGFKIKGATIKMMERGKTDERAEASLERLRDKTRAEELSKPFRAALDVYRRNGGSSAQGIKALKGYAAEEGLMLDGAAFYKAWDASSKVHGGENTVLFRAGHAEKLNDLGYHKGDIGGFLDRMIAHNKYFPSAAYEFMGFVAHSGKLLPMVRQRFVAVAADVRTSLTQVKNELTERGFTLADPDAGMWVTPDGKYEVFDAGRSNVLTDTKGDLHFIDAVFIPREVESAKKTGEEVGEQQVQADAGIVAEEWAGQTPERVQDTAEGARVRRASGRRTETGGEETFGEQTLSQSEILRSSSTQGRLEYLNAILSKRKVNALPLGAMKVSSNDKLKQQLNTIANVFGHEVTLLAPDVRLFFDGFIHPSDPKHIYIAENADNPHLAVFGHELTHQLKLNSESLFSELVNYLSANRDSAELGKYLQTQFNIEGTAFADTARVEDAIEEWTGDIVGHVLTKQSFWDTFYADQPIAAARIADAVRKLLDMIKNFVTTGRIGLASATIKDFKAVERNVADVLKKYSKLQRSKGLDPEYRLDFKFMTAWHGTPHTFDKFSTSAIGTGEGAQAYGYGLYFAGSKDVAEWYRDKLSRQSLVLKVGGKEIPVTEDNSHLVWRVHNNGFASAISDSKFTVSRPNLSEKMKAEAESDLATLQQWESEGGATVEESKGRLYQVELAPAEDEYLLWDKPLSEQSEKVKAALESMKQEIPADTLEEYEYQANVDFDELTGAELYKKFLRRMGSDDVLPYGTWDDALAQGKTDQAASEYLHSLGIRGIKYLDGNSRSGKKEDYNYVVFNDEDVSIQFKFLERGVAGETVEVDGVQRPATNSNGQPIHATKEGIRNFWKWFGDSKAVDEQGRPLVVYHSSEEAFNTFRRRYERDGLSSAYEAGTRQRFGKGIFFSSEPGVSAKFGGITRGFYLKINNLAEVNLGGADYFEGVLYDAETGEHYLDDDGKPLKIDNDFLPDEMAEAHLDDSGKFDTGVVVRGVYESIPRKGHPTPMADTWVVGNPSQIKSATGNTGAFSPTEPDIRFLEKLSNPTDTEAVQEGLNKWFKAATTGGRAVKDLAANLASHIMHIDRTIRMAESLKDYAPIRTNLKTLRMQRQEMAGYRQSFLYDGAVIMKRKAEAFKTAAEQKAFANMMFAASRYELHAADPSKDKWTDASWKAAGMDKLTGKTLGQAKAEVSELYSAAVKTDAQRAVHHDMLNELKKLYLEGFNAQLAPQELVYGKAEVAKAVEFVRKRKDGQPVPAKMKGIVDAIAPIVNGYPMLQGDYVPFSRLGKYIVRTFETEEGQDAKRVRTEAFDSKQAAIDRVNEVNSPGGNQRAEAEEQADYGRDVVNVPADILDKLRAAAEARGIDGEKLEALMQDAARIRATTIPRGSVVGNKLQRQGVEGYNTDLDRVFADYVSRHANSNTRLIYGSKLEQTYRDMRNDVKAYTSDPEHDAESAINMTTLINKLYGLEQQSGKDKVYDAVKLVGKATFAWYLSSPAIWLVQWTQPLMVTIPKLASKYGIRKASGEYMKATKEYLSGAYSDEKIDAFNRAEGNIGEKVVDLLRKRRESDTAEANKIDAQLKRIFKGYNESQQKLLTLKVMALRGEIDLALSHSMQDLITGATKGEQVFNAGVDKLAFFMKHSETGSRRAAAVSSFNLALAEGKSIADAADYASEVVNDTLFNMDSHNKGEFWRGNAGHLLGQFQSFRMGMLGKLMQLAKDAHGAEYNRLIEEAEKRGDTKAVEEAMTAKREARRELAFMVGMTFSLAGAAGTPVAMAMSNPVTEALWAGLSFLFGDDDDPVDLKREFEMAVRDSLGETAGTAVLKGLPAVFGLDISNRVGMGGLADVVMGEPPAGLTGTAKANWYAGRLLGPTWGMVSDGIRGMDAMAEGDLGKAIQYTSPKVVRDAVKTVDLATEGVQGGGKTILQAEDVSPWSMALMLVGINPSEVSLAQTESRYLRNISASLSSRRSQLIRDVAKANAKGDLDAQTEALAAINEWSSKQPQLKVTQEELARGIKRERDKRAGRLTDRERLIKEEYGGE